MLCQIRQGFRLTTASEPWLLAQSPPFAQIHAATCCGLRHKFARRQDLLICVSFKNKQVDRSRKKKWLGYVLAAAEPTKPSSETSWKKYVSDDDILRETPTANPRCQSSVQRKRSGVLDQSCIVHYALFFFALPRTCSLASVGGLGNHESRRERLLRELFAGGGDSDDAPL